MVLASLYAKTKQKSESLYHPTNTHNVKNVELLKHIKIIEAASTCFGLQGNHRQGATASALLKLQDWFGVDIEVVQTLSRLWRHSMYKLAQCTTHTPHRPYYAAIALKTSARRLYQH